MLRNITRSYEDSKDNSASMDIEILDIENADIDNQKGILEKIIGNKNIDFITVVNNNIKGRVRIYKKSAVKKLRRIKDTLIKEGFQYGKEEIQGDGTTYGFK